VVVEGCRIRELPDGGREFVLEDSTLSFIRIDHQSRLRFGRTEVMIGGPFVLEMGGAVHHLSPQRWDALGPLVALYPSSLRWLWTSARGELKAVFHHGAVLTVPSDPTSTAWSVGNVYAQTGGAGPRRPAA
jgi:Family of unknown function (DUF6188)